MNIFIDTREQRPLFNLSNGKASKNFFAKKTLNVGDYTTDKLHGKFHVERKSPGDLYGTLLGGHTRFRKELYRARDQGITLVMVIEVGEKKFYAKAWPGGKFCKFPSATIKKCIATMTVKYNLEFVWCRSRAHAKKIVLERFAKEEKSRFNRLSDLVRDRPFFGF